MSTIFEVQGLTVRYGGLKALDDVSFGVPEGSFLGLIGPNGAGKTTFMDAVSGMTPSAGRVLLDGRDINGLVAHRRVRAGVGRTFQSLELFDDLSVWENLLAAVGDQRWWSLARDLVKPQASVVARSQVQHALQLLDLRDIAGLMPSDLSLGQRKLVSVARALARQSKVLLLDEPAAGLDTAESAELGQRLRGIIDEGVTIILVDHDMGLVLSVCDEIKVLDFGRLIAGGPPEEIRSDPKVISAYLGVDGSIAQSETVVLAAAVADAGAS